MIPTQGVVVVLQDIAAGQPIARTSVRVVQFPLGTIPTSAYGVVDSVVGRVARINIYKGEVIVPRRLAPD